MTAKEQLLQELSSIPDNLIVETLNFVRFLKTKERFSQGDSSAFGGSLPEVQVEAMPTRTSLSAAAEVVRDFYAEGSELTEFSD